MDYGGAITLHGRLIVLQVTNTCKHQHLGQLVLHYRSKLTVSKGLEVTAPEVLANVAPQAIFEKLGFKITDKVYWTIKPNFKSNIRYNLPTYLQSYDVTLDVPYTGTSYINKIYVALHVSDRERLAWSSNN
uniref:GCN5-related N-acetyltransferase Rv2170-like domain-containing protein n=1 Tax=Glossina pallidipes TaxID=7398 RepID=A0A1B0A4I2_GLOPL